MGAAISATHVCAEVVAGHVTRLTVSCGSQSAGIPASVIINRAHLSELVFCWRLLGTVFFCLIACTQSRPVSVSYVTTGCSISVRQGQQAAGCRAKPR